MPEGDTIHLLARMLARALVGQRVVRFTSALPALNRIDEDHPLAGRTIDAVTARGKHLLIAFSGGLVLHTHLRMNGSWHLYRPGARWRRPQRDMRVAIETPSAVAVGFNLPVAEFLTARTLARHRTLAALGPDLLDPTFDAGEARRRMREHAHEAIGDVLLDQRVVSGIGNVFKSEILFLAGVDPFASAGTLDDGKLTELIDIARRQLRVNVDDRRLAVSAAIGRRTTGSLNPHEKLWVYGRGGKPCRRCGTPIEATKTGVDARLTYWCPRCQAAPRGSGGQGHQTNREDA